MNKTEKNCLKLIGICYLLVLNSFLVLFIFLVTNNKDFEFVMK